MAGSHDITADASVATAKKSAAYFKKLVQNMHMSSGADSLREADYQGHHIAIKTIYQITIDGHPFTGDLGVTNAGNVHYHGIPNTSFASALDLVKSVIDTFPAQFGSGAPTPEGPTEPGHGHGGKLGMQMPARGARKNSAPARARRAASSQAAKKGRR